MTFSVDVARRSDAAVVAMKGDLDIATEAQATAQLERGLRFGVVRGGGMVARLLDVTRIGDRFPVVDDPADLLDAR